MAIIWYDTENSYNGDTIIAISDQYVCSGEDYIQEPIVYGQIQSKANNGNESDNTITSAYGYEVVNSEYFGGRFALYLVETLNWSTYAMKYGLTQNGNIGGHSPAYYDFKTYEGDTGTQSVQGIGLDNYTNSNAYYHLSISTNIPIFENYNDYETYIRTGNGIENALNYSASDVEVPTDDILLYSYGVLQTWDNTGLIYENDSESVAFHKGIRGKLERGSISLYPITGINDSALKYGIKMSSDIKWLHLEQVDGHSYSWVEAEEVTLDFLYRKRDNELGTFHASKIALDTNSEYNAKIPIFEDEQTAQDYIDGNADITVAINWPTISDKYPVTNGTEEGDTQTEFGQNYMRSVFSQLYLMNSGGLSEVANNLFDVSVGGIWDKIKKGVEMYGTDPMECVQGLTFYPFDLSSVFSNFSNQQYVYFGGYQLDMENTVKKVIYPQGYKDLGTMTIKRSFNNWRDFEPYTKLFVYLPYVGVQQLSLARYYDKTVTVRYYIDIRTAVCMVVLIADGIMLDYFMGQMGVQMPITLTDFAQYSANQINTMLEGASTAMSMVNPFCGSIASLGVKTASRVYAGEDASVAKSRKQHKRINKADQQHLGSTQMMAYTAAAEIGAMGVAGGLTAMKTTFELSQNGIAGYNKTKGCSTSLLNTYLPQYITFMFEIMDADESEYLNELAGRPTNKSGRISDFSGYLECDDVMLICPIATDAEREEIIDLVTSGVYL